MGEFIVINCEPYRQPAIINIDAIAVIRPKTAPDGTRRMDIVMSSGVIVTTDATFEHLAKRLNACPIQS